MTEEIITENFTKKKRGRPFTFIGEFCERNKNLYQDIINGKSHRSYENELYQLDALTTIGDFTQGYTIMKESLKPYRWLTGEGPELRGKKRTILTELGRLHLLTNNDEEIIELAKLICETKPNTQHTVKSLREYRIQLKNKLIMENFSINI
jgi:hypothetical protein